MFRIVLSILAVVSMIAVAPLAAAAQSAPPRATAKPAAPSGQVNINTASVADFDALPGIGAKTAALIVEYRQKNGPFKKIEELLETSRSVPIFRAIASFRRRRPVSGSRKKSQEIWP